MMCLRHLVFTIITLSGIFQLILGDNGLRVSRLPLWKSLLIHHLRWSGYYVHNETRVPCSMYVHSVMYQHQGSAYITFTSGNGFHIEMTGFSADNKTVTFKEEHSWNNTGHLGHSEVMFEGAFVSDTSYFKYKANVSSKEARNYGTVSLIPQDNYIKPGKNVDNTFSLGLSIGIPLLLGTIVLTLAGFIVVWAVRKGYLRHVPWTYKTFRNSTKRSDVEMDGEQQQQPQSQQEPPVTPVEGAETMAVHI